MIALVAKMQSINYDQHKRIPVLKMRFWDVTPKIILVYDKGIFVTMLECNITANTNITTGDRPKDKFNVHRNLLCRVQIYYSQLAIPQFHQEKNLSPPTTLPICLVHMVYSSPISLLLTQYP